MVQLSRSFAASVRRDRVSKPTAAAMIEADKERAEREQAFQRQLVKHNTKLAAAARQTLGLAPGTKL